MIPLIQPTTSLETSGETPVTVTQDAAAPAKRGIVVIQEAFGITDHIVAICERLAQAGFTAAAPHLYHREGAPAPVSTDFAVVRPLMEGLTADGLRTDLAAAISILGDLGCAEVGVIGFCAGGSIALWAATILPVTAAVSYYGGCLGQSRWPGVPSGLESAADLAAPWLGIYGDLDQSIPVDQVEELKSILSGVDMPTDVLRYSDAGHGFNNDTRPDHFHPEAAADAWAHTIAWFDAHLSS